MDRVLQRDEVFKYKLLSNFLKLRIMNYQEFSGETISKQDKAFAQEFASFVNGRQCELVTPWRGYHRGTIVARTVRGFIVQFSSGAEIEVYEDEIEFD